MIENQLNKNHTKIIEKLHIYFNHKKPTKIIADHGFNDLNVKDFLRNQNIELHITKPNSHTGNSDIERLHNTLTEKIRILNIDQPNSINVQTLEAVRSYNNQFHSTTKFSPTQAENDHTLNSKICNNLLTLRCMA